MAIKFENVGIAVRDIEATIAFFTDLGLTLIGRDTVSGEWTDTAVGLDGNHADIAMLQTPDGHGQLELFEYIHPEAIESNPTRPNDIGMHRVAFSVDDIDKALEVAAKHGCHPLRGVATYKDIYKLTYLRGPSGILVMLAEELNKTDTRIGPIDIDVTFDFRSDTPKGSDPDAASPTLRRYHRQLWSKPLPLQNGALFDLDASNPRRYLHHKSELGEFFLSSDAIIRTFRRHLGAATIMAQIPEAEQEAFSRQGYTIGGMMVFPGNRINSKQTINQRRGTHPLIADRFDLTLECIRRHYLREANPLSDTLVLYADFFDLFVDFRGYVDFFLLQDLVTNDYGAIRFLLPFADFTTPAVPTTLAEYVSYRQSSLEFVAARNARIAAFSARPT
jgi:glyoxylase I family protein